MAQQQAQDVPVIDIALRLRRGQLKAKDVPPDVLAKTRGVTERDLLRHAIATSGVKRFARFNKPPAARRR
jgi:hypothetical protein